MSVINKMLRDLDQRNNAGAGVNQVIARQHGQPLWLTFLLLLTFCLLCFAIYAVLSRSSVVEPATFAAAVAEPVVQPAAELVTPAEVVTTHSPATAQSFAATLPLVTTDVATAAPQPAPQQHTEKPAGLTAMRANAAPDPANQVTQPAEVARATDITKPQPAVKSAGSLSVTSREPTTAQQQAKLRQQAVAATQAGQPQQALRYWQQLQQVAPQDALVYLAQARLWLQLGQPQQAEASLLQAKSQGIVDADIQLMLAQAAASRQQWLQAEALLPAGFALALHPDYYGLKATALQQLQQHQQAFEWFAELSQLQPQVAKWWLGGAVSLEALARPGQAHQYYLNALQWGDSLSVQSKTYIQQRLVATE